MVLLDICTHDKQEYRAKDFNMQKSYSFIIDLEDGEDGKSKNRYVETGVYLHWNDEKIVDIAVDISCMCGCRLSCRFCSSSGYFNDPLSCDQMVAQVRLSLDYIKACEGKFLSQCNKITLSFEGMGEPSYCGENISETIKQLKTIYANEFETIQFIISTTAAMTWAIKEWADNKDIHLQSLQISLHAPTDEKRKSLISPRMGIDPIQSILNSLDYFHKNSESTQIKINYLVIAGINDTEDDLNALIGIMKDKPYYLKLSHLNETGVTQANKLMNPKDNAFRNFFEKCKAAHRDTYEYGVLQSINISCGQLAAYANKKSIGILNNRSIKEIYDQIIDGDVILFLGAGVSSTFRNSRMLANELFEKLFADDSENKKQYYNVHDNLTEVADFYGIERKNELHEYLQKILYSLPYPKEFLELTKYQWNTIYTTNYDSFVENAYHDAFDNKLTDCQCISIVNQKDLAHTLPNNAVPLIKLHGSITQDFSQNVISSIDYLNNYESNRQYLFKMLESDFLRHTLVFAGYSFKDHYLSQLLFNAHKAKQDTGKKSYAVLPWNDKKGLHKTTLLQKYGTELIDCTFEDFINELARLRKSLKVFISGSKKASIADSTRKDHGEKIEAFCKILGGKFKDDGISLVTGATATDKVGYLVAKNMDDRKVKTYYRHGADAIDENEISKMIGREEYGMQPIDVIDKAIRVCNVAIFIGGASICLEEIMQAISRGKLIIPIKLGDRYYASDIIYTYIKNNLEMVSNFETDASKMPRIRAHRFFNQYLNGGVIEKLSLEAHDTEAVAETVMGILRRFRMDS